MRKFIAIGIVLLLAVGLIVDRGLEAEPAITANAASSFEAPSQLADLGPVALINNTYTASVAALCDTQSGASGYIASFDAATLGASGTIITASAVPLVGFAIATVLPFPPGQAFVIGGFPGPCGGAAVTVTGTINDGGVTHFYTVTIGT